jgi:FKBP12-rapamycin complex-associated protein
LVDNSGEFMLARFKDCCETILSYKEHRNQLIRETVISSLPKLALYCPEAFV